MNRIIKDYFTFSAKERIAVTILLLLIGGFIALPYLFQPEKKKPPEDAALHAQLAQLQQPSRQQDGKNEEDWQQPYQASSDITPQQYELFSFDPNTLEAKDWKRLGLSDKTIHTILNYRSKGGKFRTPEDLRKIWGLKKEIADRIVPFAKLPPLPVRPFNAYGQRQMISVPPITTPLDINTATPQQLMQVPGMDHSIPYRIISYRDKLGGFFNPDQVKQTYGMNDSVYRLIRPFLKTDSTTIPKININTCTVYQLNREPVISRNIAQAIIIYRNHHGAYQQVTDIRKIAFLTEEMFQKIAVYLTVQ